MKNSLTISLPEIPQLAKKIALQLKGGEILALIGPLGSGKTTFAAALGKRLKIRARLTSPTFGLMHKFLATLPHKKIPLEFYHLDLYRTKGFRELKSLGVVEVWGSKKTITVIEWANKIARHLPKKTHKIYFKNRRPLLR